MNPQNQFCQNPACSARGKVGQKDIAIHSKKERRYRCTVCDETFVGMKGTPFYRLHKPKEFFTIFITLIAYGCRVQAIFAAFGLA